MFGNVVSHCRRISIQSKGFVTDFGQQTRISKERFIIISSSSFNIIFLSEIVEQEN